MKQKPTSFELERQSAKSQGPIRKSVLILTALIGLGAMALIVVASKRGRLQDASSSSAAETGQVLESSGASRVASERVSSNSSAIRVQSRRARQPVATPSEPEQSENNARQLVKRLSEVNLQPGELTPVKAEQWRRNLVDLIGQGTAAVPVLQEFFQRNEDVRFDSGTGTNLLGEPTLRIALMKVLFDLPAPANVELQEKMLRIATDPDEIALLARQLQSQEPWKHREAIIKAAKAALERARNGQLPGRDTTALTKVLEYHGVTEAK